ncbi:MAG: type II toxin-antitoxin system RelE/ParE family toxin [Cyanobacteriota bacterium]|nr:type II toxin-antitoxin system RelE/ParE family toxin [Cyanobacteriota bacterium]
MSPFELTPYAEEDLADITEYTVNNHGIAQAKEYITALERCAESLANSYGYYRELKNIHPRLRAVRCQHHYIFGMMRAGKPMVVIAIYHERMDVLRRLKTRLRNPQKG